MKEKQLNVELNYFNPMNGRYTKALILNVELFKPNFRLIPRLPDFLKSTVEEDDKLGY